MLFLAYYEDRLDAGMLERLLLPKRALQPSRRPASHLASDEPLEVTSSLPLELREFFAVP